MAFRPVLDSRCDLPSQYPPMTIKPLFILFAALVPPLALFACSPEVTLATSSGAGGSSTSSSSTGSTSSGMSTGTGTSAVPCGDSSCAAGQLCVVPACRDVLGEECYFAAADAGEVCPPGTKRGPQFDSDCPTFPGGSSYACVSGCPPPPPFCVDLPSGCADMPTCACLANDPCESSNSGVCHDADIQSGILTCSLMP